MELQRDLEPAAPRRAESRIPKCTKYELPDGYRLVLQRAIPTRRWSPSSSARTTMSIHSWMDIKVTSLTKRPASCAS